jgi:vacuolar protein-sorting-associated protein 4
MSLYVNFKDKGIDYAKQAVAEDELGNYEKAITLYTAALEYFKTYLKYEKNPKAQEAIMGKFKEYLTRAEYLKGVAPSAQADGPENGAAAASKARKPGQGGGGKEEDDKEKDKMKASLSGAIVSEKPNVKWTDVAGLDGAKEALKEAVILPVKFPQFFTGKRKPWSGILLYGPPGTGKSYLAKAVATEADSTFFSISSSDLVSKWLGESEKLVSQLFSLAREQSPSIIFIDEVDSLCSSRGDNESEAARRIKTQLMVEIQGVGTNNSKVLVLAATNLPYNLDQAIRRRFDKRIYIPLPEAPARAHMFKIHLGDTPNNLTDADFAELGEKTEGFSGSDCSVMVKDVLMQPIRLLREATHFKQVRGPDGKAAWEPCSPGAPGAEEKNLTWFSDNDLASAVLPPSITFRDFERVLQKAKPTVRKSDLGIFEKLLRSLGRRQTRQCLSQTPGASLTHLPPSPLETLSAFYRELSPP